MSPSPDGDTIALTLGRAGMFGAVNTAAGFAHLAARDGRKLVIRWPNSVYRDALFADRDTWSYFFAPPFEAPDQAPDAPDLPNAREVYPGTVFSTDHVIAPRARQGLRDALLRPHDRRAGHAVLNRFIRPNVTTRAFYNDFSRVNFSGPIIGLHIRGPGRLDGGAAQLRRLLDPSHPVPFAHYAYATQNALARHPDARIFLATDSIDVIHQAKAYFGDRVFTYPATRSPFGEMHARHPENHGRLFSPYKLGLDIIAEAHLLAKCDHFIHGNSNVANYVLCRAPDMPATYVYERVEPRFLAEIDALRAQGKVS